MLEGLWGMQKNGSTKVWRSAWTEFMTDIWTSILTDPLSRSKRGTWGPDQTLLEKHVWGEIPGGVVQHDSYACHKFPGTIGFPSQRPNSTGFIGNIDKDEPDKVVECPKKCRRKGSWKFC